MGGDEIAVLMRFFTDGTNHFRRHLQFAGNTFFFCIQNTAGDHKFDQIHLFFFRTFQCSQCVRNISGSDGNGTCHMTAGNRDSLIGSENPGTDFFPGCNLIAQASIKISESANGSNGRNTSK